MKLYQQTDYCGERKKNVTSKVKVVLNLTAAMDVLFLFFSSIVEVFISFLYIYLLPVSTTIAFTIKVGRPGLPIRLTCALYMLRVLL